MNVAFPPASNARYFALRLRPGEDVIPTLRHFIQQNHLKAAFIAGCVGSLTRVNLRFAGKETTDQFVGRYEIVSLIGTLDSEGEHLHLAISDENGHVQGGHMMLDCTIRTTLELVIGELEHITFTRQYCELSGYDELAVSERTPHNSHSSVHR
ncbi:PPC domain-containing DNA-binding protein [Providencia stuartii]|uniref:PPC domain-containing DNA-binding protein n=1 Tax=Providencia stuartii TaxID=588 RepID=UPI003D7FF04C